MKAEKPNKFPSGLPHPKPPSEKSMARLQSALSLEKTNPIPLAKQPFAKSRGSAISKTPNLSYKKPNFKITP
jgi:hypothetical protein